MAPFQIQLSILVSSPSIPYSPSLRSLPLGSTHQQIKYPAPVLGVRSLPPLPTTSVPLDFGQLYIFTFTLRSRVHLAMHRLTLVQNWPQSFLCCFLSRWSRLPISLVRSRHREPYVVYQKIYTKVLCDTNHQALHRRCEWLIELWTD